MLVRSFLKWYRSAPVSGRIEAVGTMAAAYLSDQIGGDSRAEAEAALTLVLDDAAPAVRRALAWAFALSEQAPRHIVVGLAHDEAQVSGLILARSPHLRDADLIDCIRTGDRLKHLAIAMRSTVSAAVSAVLTELAAADVLVALLRNPGAEVQPEAFARMVARHPSDGVLRHELSGRDDLPAPVRQALVASLSADLLKFVETTGWLDGARAQRIVTDSTEMATIGLAVRAPDLGPFVDHLRASRQLTPSLLLRGLLCGQTALFGAALTGLTGFSPARVAGILKGRGGAPLMALCDKADLPRSLFPAFEAALAAVARGKDDSAGADALRLDRGIIAAVLGACLTYEEAGMQPLIAMLRRFDAEAAREDARALTEDILAAEAAETLDGVAGRVDLDALADDLAWQPALDAMDLAIMEDDAPETAVVDAGEQAPAPAPEIEAAPLPDAVVAPVAEAEPAPEWSPPVTRILHRLQARPQAMMTAPVAFAPVMEEGPAVADAPKSYHEELDDLFAQAFGSKTEPPPSQGSLRVIERDEGLDEAFFANWTLRREAA